MLSNIHLRRAANITLALAALFLPARLARAQLLLTNVQAVNVTPTSFSVIGGVSQSIGSASNVAISVFSDPGGTSNLSGTVGIQLYPLNTGDPTATNKYATLLSENALAQDSLSLGLVYARISYCAPGTIYYYRVTVTGTNGQNAVWPVSGPLPEVTTAVQNGFVLDSQQLIVTLNAANPPGSILTLSNTNTLSVIAAVVGDGTPTNQAFFNVNDLLAASGTTNFAPNGPQVFTATLLGAGSGIAQTYDLIFTNSFVVGTSNSGSIGALAVSVSVGTDAVLDGGSGSVPIYVASQSKLVNFTFTLNVATNLFSSLSLRATSPLLGSASLVALSPNQLQVTLNAASGQNLLGNQQVAALNFTIATNDASAFVQVWPRSLQGSNSDGTIPNVLTASPGRIIIVGPQPLLDTQVQDASRNLVLYGIPSESYQIQVSTNLALTNNGWSDYVRVPLTNISEVLSNVEPLPSQVFFRAYEFVPSSPILDSSNSAGQDFVTLYAAPGLAFEIQYSSSLNGPWQDLVPVAMTNSFAIIPGLRNPPGILFYRSQPLLADPPLLQPLLQNGQKSIVAYGLAGTNYTVQTTTNLSPTMAWAPLLNYTLTNSFQVIPGLPAANSIFYRIQKN